MDPYIPPPKQNINENCLLKLGRKKVELAGEWSKTGKQQAAVAYPMQLLECLIL